jgi:hypothetical protein
MDMEFVTPPSWEPVRMDMGLSIEPEIDNREEEDKGEHISIEEKKERKQRTLWVTDQHIVR